MALAGLGPVALVEPAVEVAERAACILLMAVLAAMAVAVFLAVAVAVLGRVVMVALEVQAIQILAVAVAVEPLETEVIHSRQSGQPVVVRTLQAEVAKTRHSILSQPDI